MGWLKGLYSWMMAQAEKPRALWALGLVSIAESSFFPIPVDVMLVPMVLARRAWWWIIALVASVCSVIGGVIGYFIGKLAFDTVGSFIIGLFGKQEAFDALGEQFANMGWQIVFTAGLTPLPYKVFTIASGAFSVGLGTFIIASVAARSLRFFAVSGLLALFGPTIRTFIEKYFALCTILAAVLVIGGFAAISLLH